MNAILSNSFCITETDVGLILENIENLAVLLPSDRVGFIGWSETFCFTEMCKSNEVQIERFEPLRACVANARFSETVNQINSFEEGEPKSLKANFAEIGSSDDAHETVFVGWSV